ncbi:hypothetical protein DV515_00007246 [Chloebia gouldiae]|uniref:Uncharacterized protein n=1 Tax=Chloebia gouldiae TaxID=44316 RepID=A0A3L8SJQ6_CHLGU|nr:hypothetical protein DV515_00007246 [Chloebia gouldiae]
MICFTGRKNLTIFYCILRNKPTTPSIQGKALAFTVHRDSGSRKQQAKSSAGQGTKGCQKRSDLTGYP